MKLDARGRFILLATAGYAVLALAWIFLSDQLLALFADVESMLWLSTAKGVFFVFATTAMLFLALRAVPAAGDAGAARLLDALAVGIAPGARPAWLTYGFAAAITLAMLLVHDRVAAGLGERPLLILFMFPIILGALLGGLGPGLLATALAALGAAYVALPPLHSWRIATSHDLLQWGFLIANGVAVSLLSEILRRLNAELEGRVTARTAELQAANRELEDLAYAVAHNLRAPLRAICGFSQILVEDHAAALDGEARNHLGQVIRASGDMGRQIDGILALLRSTRGELRRDRIDVSALATRRLNALAAAEPQRAPARQVDPGLIVCGDAAMLDVVLTQLLDNAWKFTRNRGDALIRVTAGEIDGQPGICIADNGAGFDMAYAKGLFQPFQRLHRQDEFPGIGIGLATVQRMIRRHGGSIRAEGKPGVGASFCFALPDVAPEEVT